MLQVAEVDRHRLRGCEFADDRPLQRVQILDLVDLDPAEALLVRQRVLEQPQIRLVEQIVEIKGEKASLQSAIGLLQQTQRPH